MNTDRGPEARMQTQVRSQNFSMVNMRSIYMEATTGFSPGQKIWHIGHLLRGRDIFFTPIDRRHSSVYTPRVSMASPEHAVYETILISCMYVPKLPKSSHSIMFNSTTPIIHGS